MRVFHFLNGSPYKDSPFQSYFDFKLFAKKIKFLGVNQFEIENSTTFIVSPLAEIGLILKGGYFDGTQSLQFLDVS